jgi:hypothetical protein
LQPSAKMQRSRQEAYTPIHPGACSELRDKESSDEQSGEA